MQKIGYKNEDIRKVKPTDKYRQNKRIQNSLVKAFGQNE